MPELLYDILCVKSVLFLESLPILKVFNLDIWKIKIFVKTIFVWNNLILDAWWNVNNQNNCPFYLSFFAKLGKVCEIHGSKSPWLEVADIDWQCNTPIYYKSFFI